MLRRRCRQDSIPDATTSRRYSLGAEAGRPPAQNFHANRFHGQELLILEGAVDVLPPILRRDDGEHVPMLRNLAVFDSKKIVVRSGRFRACLDQAEDEIALRDVAARYQHWRGPGLFYQSKEALASAILSQYFDALLETLTERGTETAGARFRRHFESLAPSTQTPGASPLLLISTLAAEGPALPANLVQQISEEVRIWSNKVAALISLAQAEGQIITEEDPDLLAALFINCWQGAVIRSKCDPSAPCDCLRLALDRVLSVSRSEA